MYAPHSAILSTACITASVIATTGGLVDVAIASPGLPVLPLRESPSDQIEQTNFMPAAVQTPLSVPAQTPLSIPAQTPLQVPSQTDLPKPSQTPLQIPAQTSPQVPIQTPLSIPAQTPLQAPSQTSLQTPSQTSLQSPGQTSLRFPAQTPLPAPAQTPLPSPVQTPLPTPAQTPLQTTSFQTSSSNSATSLVALTAATITPTNSPTFTHQLAQTEPVIPAADPLEDDFLTPNSAGPALNTEDVESEVGDIQLLSRPERSQPAGQQPTNQQTVRQQPNGQLLLRSSAFTSSNVTGNDLTQTGDLVFVNQATFLATPKLGPDTRLVATASGGLTRFAEEGNGNYNSLGFSVGIQQRFTLSTYGQLGWVNDQLYNTNNGDRTLTDNSARLLIGRQDPLNKKLRLDTTYELRARFTNPAARSRITNSLGTRLRYDLSPDWQSTLGYRLAFNDYTQTGRFDTAHQIQAATTYTPTRNTFVSGFASYTFGRSSEATTDLENLSFGLGVGVNLPLF